jgi:hypothetical protein
MKLVRDIPNTTIKTSNQKILSLVTNEGEKHEKDGTWHQVRYGKILRWIHQQQNQRNERNQPQVHMELYRINQQQESNIVKKAKKQAQNETANQPELWDFDREKEGTIIIVKNREKVADLDKELNFQYQEENYQMAKLSREGAILNIQGVDLTETNKYIIDPELSDQEKRSLFKARFNGIWTNTKRANNSNAPRKCKLCGAAEGNLKHIFLYCPALQTTRDKRDHYITNHIKEAIGGSLVTPLVATPNNTEYTIAIITEGKVHLVTVNFMWDIDYQNSNRTTRIDIGVTGTIFTQTKTNLRPLIIKTNELTSTVRKIQQGTAIGAKLLIKRYIKPVNWDDNISDNRWGTIFKK